MTALDVGALPPHAGHHEHHERPEERHIKEFLGLWLFIGGDLLFTALEIFTWIYLRALNTNGLWRGAQCSVAHPCTNGNGNPITHEIATASALYPWLAAALVTAAAALCWRMERRARDDQPFGALVGASATATAAGVAVMALNFANLPFTTVDGAYASCYEFVAASTLAHLLMLLFVMGGMGNRARLGLYGDRRWHRVRIIKMFATWIAVSSAVLALLVTAFA